MRLLTVFLPLLALSLFLCFTPSAESQGEKSPAVGMDRRVAWTTSRVKGSPEPPPPYRTEVAFPKLKFFEPLDLTAVPGSDRLAVAERPGKIHTFVNDRNTAKAELLIDLKRTIYGFTFHPRFAENGYLYVTSMMGDGPKGTRISRFQVTVTPPVTPRRQAKPAAKPLDNPLSTETIIYEWPSGGHNGGCLKFGPDGKLYISTGDGSGIADELQTGQDISDVLGAILRIDVDNPESGKAYSIPRDNPFVALPGARPEIWAYGIRQSWRMSFDRATGDLWAGEVGQDLWEMVLKIEKGGNYGWSVQEGLHPFRPERKKGPTPILKPVHEHPHSDFRSITGGFVYRGKRLPDLFGAFVYGDFDTGRFWALTARDRKVVWQRELAKTRLRPVSFGEDAAGEVYIVDFSSGQLYQLTPATKVADTSADFPRRLSETGLFTSTKDHIPAPGLIPYSVNAPLWSDHAAKDRYLALPGDSKIDYDAITYPQPAPGAPPGWRFPDGTVIVKTFSLEQEKGNPKSQRRLETRLLHFQNIPGTDEYGEGYWRGYTYVWNDEQTDAILADAAGLDRPLTIKDPQAPSGERQQTWHFPSRAECTLCHTLPAKFVLGVNTLQLNKDHDYGNGRVANQLRTLEHLGIFSKPLPQPPEKLPHMTNYEDEKQDLEKRARAYLHANCAHCHMKWGGGNAEFQLLSTLHLKETGTVDVRPGQGTFDLKDPRVLVPGDPERSMVLHRMKKIGLGRMPHVASSVVDEKGVKLVHDWIQQLKPDRK